MSLLAVCVCVFVANSFFDSSLSQLRRFVLSIIHFTFLLLLSLWACDSPASGVCLFLHFQLSLELDKFTFLQHFRGFFVAQVFMWDCFGWVRLFFRLFNFNVALMKLIGIFFSSFNTNLTHKGAIKLTWSSFCDLSCVWLKMKSFFVRSRRICREFSVCLFLFV